MVNKFFQLPMAWPGISNSLQNRLFSTRFLVVDKIKTKSSSYLPIIEGENSKKFNVDSLENFQNQPEFKNLYPNNREKILKVYERYKAMQRAEASLLKQGGNPATMI